MSISKITRMPVLLFMLTMLAATACGSSTLDANYSALTIEPVQLVDASQAKIGGNVPYLKLTLEAGQDLTALTKGLLQFRAYVVLANGERFLALGTAVVADKAGYFVPYVPKNQTESMRKQSIFSVFFFHGLVFDYDGNFKINLLKDAYKQIEFDVSYRIFSGPQLARSKGLTITRAAFLRLYQARKNDAATVMLRLD